MVWTAVGAWVQVLAYFVAALTLAHSVRSWKHSLQLQHYGDLDQLYADLLRDALTHPYLRNPSNIRPEDGEKLVEYAAYAYMSLNFVETVRDRIGNDATLHATWDPVVVFEAKLHREWFERDNNAACFKREFQNYMGSLHASRALENDLASCRTTAPRDDGYIADLQPATQ